MWAAVLASALAAGAWLAYALGERAGVKTMRASTAHRMEAYVASLQNELRRYEYLPAVVALHADVLHLLQSPATPGQVRRANLFLERVNDEAKSTAIYVMNMQGLTLAASNWSQSASFVGVNFSYRPYFTDAAVGRPGRFYGVGTISREPGYYFSQPIVHEGQRIGVAAVKVNLDRLDESWTHGEDEVLIADGNGIVFLSSRPQWRFRTLRQLSQETQGQLAATRQYSIIQSLAPIDFQERRRLGEDVSILHVRASGEDFLAQRRPIAGTDWSVLVLSDMGAIRTLARNSALATAFALGFLLLLVLYLRQRHRANVQGQQAKRALQRAHDELERKVALRTEALSSSNLQLQSEVAERLRAEQVLKAAMEELVQASKMAALGQMSASITHELNQPLQALRTLSANTIVFFQRGQAGAVEANLQMICQLVERMGKLTQQLKRFARKTPIQRHPTPIGSVVGDALFLVEARMREEGVTLDLRIPEPQPLALCEGNRLEQVVLNLLVNALDAMTATAERALRVVVSAEAPWVGIEVHDAGPGIPEAVMPRLFEPFFTTKEQGLGLGLGLAISAGIVNDFGGAIRVARSPLGGALFLVQLRAATADDVHESS